MKTKIMHSLAALMVIALALTGCFDVPPPLYNPIDPDEENARTPVIISVDKTSMWTDDTLTITGTNFSDSLDWNYVYFFESNTPVVGDTTETIDSTDTDATYNILSDFKNIAVTTSGYRTTITTIMNGLTTVESFVTPTMTEEYTQTDSVALELTGIQTIPVFTLFDTTWNDTSWVDTVITDTDTTYVNVDTSLVASIDTTGYTKMYRTVTTYDNITDWVAHTGRLGTVVEASETELKVIPPDIDAIQSKIVIHVQNAIAPARWGYIDLMVKP